MERLTKYAIPKFGRGIPKKCPCLSNSIVKNDCPPLFCHKAEKCDSIKNRKCPYLQVMDKLAAYEDTGLEPEEIKEWIEAGKELFFERSGLYAELGPIDHLLDFAQAEKDGRLVVLPDRLKMLECCPMRHPDNGNCVVAGGFCKPGTEICEALHAAYEEGLFNAREEAEAALKKEGD